MEGTEQDIHNFSTSSSHRLPTISATEALQTAAKLSKALPTSLPGLDSRLQTGIAGSSNGGIQRGYITEVYGPPGVGKTTLALQVAINTVNLYDDHRHVVWIDTGSPLAPRRVSDLMKAYKMPEGHEPPSSPPEPRLQKDLLKRMTYYQARTLPRLLVMMLHPTTSFLPPGTALIVVDDLSSLVLGSFPKSAKLRKAEKLSNGLYEKLAKKAASKKWTVIADLASAMSNLAASRNIAIIAINQIVTSLKHGRKAALKSALSAQPWDNAVQSKVLLYRDFATAELVTYVTETGARNLRYAEIVKKGGKEVAVSEAVPFTIHKAGLEQVLAACVPTQPSQIPNPQPGPLANVSLGTKRKVEEIADSEDEDAGSSDHEAAVSMGSESADELAGGISINNGFGNPFANASDGELTPSDDEMDPS